MVEIVGCRQDDFIPFVAEHRDGGGEGLITARGDRHVLCGDLAIVGRAKLRRDLGAQVWQAKDRAIKVGIRVVQYDFRHRGEHRRRWRINRGRLTDVQEWAVSGMVYALKPAAGLHDGGRKGGCCAAHDPSS